MKLVILVIAIFINFFNHSLSNSEEKINSTNNIIDNIAKKESLTEDKSEIRKIHIVKIGDTISNISKLYSINKDSIIKLNNLKDENYIYIGQNLIISESTNNPTQKSDFTNKYHIVQIGENITEISNKYNLKSDYLIEINNLKNPDSIKVGEKLFLSKNNQIKLEDQQIINNTTDNELTNPDKKIYGPIIIQSKSSEKINGRNVFNVLNQQNKKLILSIKCDTRELDIRIPGRKWRGWEPAKEIFEKNLIDDFC